MKKMNFVIKDELEDELRITLSRILSRELAINSNYELWTYLFIETMMELDDALSIDLTI